MSSIRLALPSGGRYLNVCQGASRRRLRQGNELFNMVAYIPSISMKTASIYEAACASGIEFATPPVATTSLADTAIQILHHETGHLLISICLMNHTESVPCLRPSWGGDQLYCVVLSDSKESNRLCVDVWINRMFLYTRLTEGR